MIDIKKRHRYWWYYLLERVWAPDNFDRVVPGIEFSTRLTKFAAKANSKRCEYNINYALQENDKYDETICHEVCHTFAKRLLPHSRHDSLWYYLYNIVCESSRGRYNGYTSIINKTQRTESMKAVKELLRLQEKIATCESKPA